MVWINLGVMLSLSKLFLFKALMIAARLKQGTFTWDLILTSTTLSATLWQKCFLTTFFFHNRNKNWISEFNEICSGLYSNHHRIKTRRQANGEINAVWLINLHTSVELYFRLKKDLWTQFTWNPTLKNPKARRKNNCKNVQKQLRKWAH